MRRRTTPDASATDPDETEADEAEAGPLRRCAVTRARLAKEAMIRFVVAPDRRIVPDLTARLPGRGIWLSARGDVLETARTRGAFARAARGPVTVSPDLTSELKLGLARRIGDTLGLARRAGQAVCGFAKAREWLDSGQAALVVQAHDGSVEERTRFLAGVRDVAVAAPLAAAALGAVFGRDHVVHVTIASGRLAEALRNETERLAGFTGEARATGAALPRRVGDSQGG